MRARRLVCSICRQSFTRRWNAQRHNKHAHAGAAKIFPTNSLQNEKAFGGVWPPQENHSPTYEPRRDRLFEILEQIGKEFEECERELQNYPIEIKYKMLSSELQKAIVSDSPKLSMKRSVESIRSAKMIDYVGKATNQAPPAAEEMLRSIIEHKNYR